ncbi:mechanosensitive ion channel [Mesobaculum littorinae]|uniref:Mechanosensitive ion channel n=1 Tax=Mesobaculum littorinae TaxID=2486419 RepID=A0A438AMD8_9RHOB|nr:mechanosensitive ion channel domain-containing protein [Mesobaculum littorinae]RVV99757.1 mechanosensitive ion channel [Mesobaculum littorinae]
MSLRVPPVIAALFALLFCLVAAPPLAAQDAFYEVDALNAGLPPVPEDFYRDNPQEAVESFLDAAEDEDWARAVHALNLNRVDEADQAERGPPLARQLARVLDRRVVISWRRLLERPDALDAQASSSAATAGQPRRSLLLAVLDRGPREGAIRLERIKAGDDDPVWVFSDRTVELVPELYRLYGPSSLESSLPDWLRKQTFWGIHVWELIGLPVVLITAYLAGRLLHRLFGWLSRKATHYWTTVTLRALRWPSIIVVVTTILLYSTLRIFVFSGPVSTIIVPLTVIGYVTAILIFALNVIDTVLDRLVTFDSDKLSDPDNQALRSFATSMSAGRRALIVLALLIAAGTALASANLFRTLGFSLLASAGALTLILGFAARQILGNILASMQIAMNRSARIGDFVVFKDHWCTVERIHFTFVQLRTWTGNRLVVPVSDFVSDSFENWSLIDSGMIRVIDLTLAQTADVGALRERFHAIVDDHDQIERDDNTMAMVLSQDGFGQVVRFTVYCRNQMQAWAIECDIREKLMVAARELEENLPQPVLPQARMDDMAG